MTVATPAWCSGRRFCLTHPDSRCLCRPNPAGADCPWFLPALRVRSRPHTHEWGRRAIGSGPAPLAASRVRTRDQQQAAPLAIPFRGRPPRRQAAGASAVEMAFTQLTLPLAARRRAPLPIPPLPVPGGACRRCAAQPWAPLSPSSRQSRGRSRDGAGTRRQWAGLVYTRRPKREPGVSSGARRNACSAGISRRRHAQSAAEVLPVLAGPSATKPPPPSGNALPKCQRATMAESRRRTNARCASVADGLGQGRGERHRSQGLSSTRRAQRDQGATVAVHPPALYQAGKAPTQPALVHAGRRQEAGGARARRKAAQRLQHLGIGPGPFRPAPFRHLLCPHRRHLGGTVAGGSKEGDPASASAPASGCPLAQPRMGVRVMGRGRRARDRTPLAPNARVERPNARAAVPVPSCLLVQPHGEDLSRVSRRCGAERLERPVREVIDVAFGHGLLNRGDGPGTDLPRCRLDSRPPIGTAGEKGGAASAITVGGSAYGPVATVTGWRRMVLSLAGSVLRASER